MINKWNNGYNTVLTGQAGSGKSWTVQHEIIEKYGDFCKIALTGMTGLASCNIKGQTIHSWLNLKMIEVNKKDKDNGVARNFDRIIYNPHAKWEHVKDTDVLIIDEISMCNSVTFDVIDAVLKWVKKNNAPFGGIQMILVGDCYQLPPVKAKDYGYFFQSKAYKQGNFTPFVLHQQHRQKTGKFLDILNRIRVGKHTQDDVDYLNEHCAIKPNEMGFYEIPNDTTILYPKNEEVKKINKQYFDSIKEPIDLFEAKDEILIPLIRNKKGEIVSGKDYGKNLRVGKTLELKSGCNILLLSNLDVANGIVNGSRGKYIRRYCDNLLCEFNGEYIEVPKQKFEVYEQDKLVFIRTQYPLVLGRALTIHKSQGMTLDSVYIDFSNSFENQQVYVALSRVKSLDGLYIKGLTKNKITISKEVIDYMKDLEK